MYSQNSASLRFARSGVARTTDSIYRHSIQFYSFCFFWIFRLRIYTLYVIFTSYGLYPWKSSWRSPIKIFSPQSHFTIWVLSRVYVIYGENSIWFYGPLLVLFKFVYVDFQIEHLQKPPNLYFYKSIFLALSVAYFRNPFTTLYIYMYFLSGWYKQIFHIVSHDRVSSRQSWTLAEFSYTERILSPWGASVAYFS